MDTNEYFIHKSLRYVVLASWTTLQLSDWDLQLLVVETNHEVHENIDNLFQLMSVHHI